MLIYVSSLYFISQLHLVLASEGDYSNEFRGCFHTCHFNNCSEGTYLDEFYVNQNFFDKLFRWSCEDECKYVCMWHATNIYMQKELAIPQFYGKWPFVKVFGLQEPASVLFSFLNLAAHSYNMIQFRRVVPSNAPLYLLWHLHFVVCVNGWFWSMWFHARDTPFSERLDYFSAFLMVLFSFVMLLIRTSGKGNVPRKVGLFLVSALFFMRHVWYLSSQKFDYGYNMKVNVTVGVLNGCGWLWWSYRRGDGHKRAYLVWCRATMVGMGMTMFLELFDFPPLLWAFDAHALWHLATSVLPFLWYKFFTEDCLYLLEKSSSHSLLKKYA